MKPFGVSTVRVRYEETDQGGIAHHSRHIVWFERSRTRLCDGNDVRKMEMPYTTLESQGIRLLVAEVSVQYRSPALYDDLLKIETRLRESRGARIVLDYEVTSPRGETVCHGSTTLACIDAGTGRPTRLPAFFTSFNEAGQAQD